MDALQIEKIYELFSAGAGAHNDMSLRFVGTEDNGVVLEMPFQEKHATDYHNGSLHTGALAAALDSACGFVVLLGLEAPQAIATINLRIDHIQVAPVGKDVRIEAECYQRTSGFAYVSALACSLDGNTKLCSALGIFKIGSPGPPLDRNLLNRLAG
tara:strand:+ start:10673 stop:11140 length:468 start_codon:yes stop_codon:yes gene_type:complete